LIDNQIILMNTKRDVNGFDGLTGSHGLLYNPGMNEGEGEFPSGNGRGKEFPSPKPGATALSGRIK
jgi:hypothetical protein